MPRHRKVGHPSSRAHQVEVDVYAPTEWGGVRRVWSWYLHFSRKAVDSGLATWCWVRDLYPVVLQEEPEEFNAAGMGVLLNYSPVELAKQFDANLRDTESLCLPIPQRAIERDLLDMARELIEMTLSAAAIPAGNRYARDLLILQAHEVAAMCGEL